MIEERRKYIRLNAALDFTYKIKDAKGPEIKEVTKNICPGGIGCPLNKDIKKGDWLELSIYIPGSEEPLYAVGKVAWTGEENLGKINVGIKFEEIESEVKNKFLEYICQLMFSELERLRV